MLIGVLYQDVLQVLIEKQVLVDLFLELALIALCYLALDVQVDKAH